MVNYEQLINGVSKFIDSEIISQLTGNSKVFLGIGAGIALKKGETLYNNTICRSKKASTKRNNKIRNSNGRNIKIK